MELTLYGLKNCDSCRKAAAWLNSNGIAYRFHDIRDDGLETAVLDRWLDGLGWEVLLNRRSTTWRQLPEGDQAHLDMNQARWLLLRHPTLIKRPILEGSNVLQAGFSAGQYATVLAGAD